MNLGADMDRLARGRLAERGTSHVFLCALRSRGLRAPRCCQHPGQRFSDLLNQWLIDGNVSTASQGSLGGFVGLTCRDICGAQGNGASARKRPPQEKQRASLALSDGATSPIGGPKNIKLPTFRRPLERLRSRRVAAGEGLGGVPEVRDAHRRPAGTSRRTHVGADDGAEVARGHHAWTCPSGARSGTPIALVDAHRVVRASHLRRLGPVLWHAQDRRDDLQGHFISPGSAPRLDGLVRPATRAQDGGHLMSSRCSRSPRTPGAPEAQGFKPDSPWEWGVRHEDTAVGRRELEEPVIFVLARASELSSMIGGDAMTSATASGARGAGGRAAARPSAAVSTQHRAGQPDKHHTTNDGGTMAANRRGKRLWEVCEVSPMRRVCPKGQNFAHQCARCLLLPHTAGECREKGA